MADMSGIGGFVTGASQFLQGYLSEKERLDEKEKKEKERQKIEKMVNSGEWDVIPSRNAAGDWSYQFRPKKDRLEAENKMYQKQLLSFQNAAAEQGQQLNINPNMPMAKQLDTARRLYASGQAGQPKVKPKVPTWKQQQAIASLKVGLRRGKVVLGKQFGEPSVYEIKNLKEALNAIGEAGLDPALFKEELALWDITEMGKTPQGRRVAKLRDGRIIYFDTKEEVK